MSDAIRKFRNAQGNHSAGSRSQSIKHAKLMLDFAGRANSELKANYFVRMALKLITATAQETQRA